MKNAINKPKYYFLTFLMLFIFNLQTPAQSLDNINWEEIFEEWQSLADAEKAEHLKPILLRNNYPKIDPNTLKSLRKSGDKIILAQLYFDAKKWDTTCLILASISSKQSQRNIDTLLPLLSQYFIERNPSLKENQDIVNLWYQLTENKTANFSKQQTKNLIKIAVSLKDLKKIFEILDENSKNLDDKLLSKAHFLLLATTDRWGNISEYSTTLVELKEKISREPDHENYQNLFYYFAQLKPDILYDVSFKTYFLHFLKNIHKLDLQKRIALFGTFKNNEIDHSYLTEWLKSELPLKQNLSSEILSYLTKKSLLSWEDIIKRLNPDIIVNQIYLDDTNIPNNVKLLLLTRWQSNWKPDTNWFHNENAIEFDDILNAETVVMHNKNSQSSSLTFLNRKLSKIDFLFFQIKGINSNEPILISIRLNSKTIKQKIYLSNSWKMVRVPLDDEKPTNKIEIKIHNENKASDVSFQISEPTTLTILKQ